MRRLLPRLPLPLLPAHLSRERHRGRHGHPDDVLGRPVGPGLLPDPGGTALELFVWVQRQSVGLRSQQAVLRRGLVQVQMQRSGIFISVWIHGLFSVEIALFFVF